jgi:4-hydroxybenzoate polyprenyltransferase
MIIIPFSLMNEILGELKDLDVDKKTNINNTIQKFKGLDIKKLFIILVVITIIGFSIIFFTILPEYKIINILISLFLGIVAIFRMRVRMPSGM